MTNIMPNEKEYWEFGIQFLGRSLKQLQEENVMLYCETPTKWERLRKSYININAPIPTQRVNIYICGKSGVGKSVMSWLLADTFFYNKKIVSTDPAFFPGLGSRKIKGYDGEPAIIWNSCGASFFTKWDFHTFSYVFEIPFDRTIPKFGSVLLNQANIVNSTVPFGDFIQCFLSSKFRDYRSEEDIYKLFPIVIYMKDNTYDLCINRGIFDENYKIYTCYEDIKHDVVAAITIKDQELSRSMLFPILNEWENISKYIQLEMKPRGYSRFLKQKGLL